MTDCIFCSIIQKRIPAQIIAETDDLIAIKDRAPKTPIHYLIIPKIHIPDIQSLEKSNCCLGSKMMFMAQQLAKDAGDFKFLINSGHKAGQRVFHLHAHFLAGIEMAE